MRKLLAIGAIAFLLVPLGKPPEPPAEPSSNGLQFIGYTTATFPGNNAGVFELQRQCYIELQAQMCNSKQVLSTTNPPVVSGSGWILPYFIGADGMLVDYSGVSAANVTMFTCEWWTSEGTCLRMNYTGGIDLIDFDHVLPVACCK